MSSEQLESRGNRTVGPWPKVEWGRPLLVTLSLVLAGTAGYVSAHPASTPAAVVAAARSAVSPGKATARVTSLVLNGVSRSADMDDAGALLAPSPLEIRIVLPDGYLEISRLDPAVIWSWGTYGGAPVNKFTPLQPGIQTKSSVEGVLDEAQLTLACFTLGVLADTNTVLGLSPVRLTSCGVGCTEVRMSGRSGVSADLEVDSSSWLPLRVRYEGRVRFPRPRHQTPAGRPPLPTPLPAAESAPVVLSFDERRLVDGLRLPFLIRKTSRGVLLREIRIEKVAVNPPSSGKEIR